MRNENVGFLRSMRLPAKFLSAIVCVGIVTACAVNAMAIDSVVFHTRVFNDNPTSTVVTTSTYPTQVQISDTTDANPSGFANLHTFHLADAGVEHPFANNEPSSFFSDLTISGTGQGEAAMQLSPWWSQNADGFLNFRTTDGEIAAFGGRLPFYSFTGSQGLHYVKGTTVRAGFIYNPRSLSAADPATIQYFVTMPDAITYTSGAIAFDEGNAAEGFGSWGHLDDARIGGEMKIFTGQSGPLANLTATWSNLSYVSAVPEPTTLALLSLAVIGFIGMRRRSN